MMGLLLMASKSADAFDDPETAMALHNVIVSCRSLRGRATDTVYQRYDSNSFIVAIDNCSS